MLTVKQPPHKCLAAWLLALVMALTLLPVRILALEEADEEVSSISVEFIETSTIDVGGQSDAELLEG